MIFSEDFISEINKEFSFIDVIPTPCGIINLDDNCIVKGNSLFLDIFKIPSLPISLENFTGSDFSAMLNGFPETSDNIIKTNTEIINMTDSEGKNIAANIDIRIIKSAERNIAVTVFKLQPEQQKNNVIKIESTVPEVYELVDGIFDNLPFLVCIPDNVHNDFIYTNKYAEEFFASNKGNESKILSLTEIGKTNIPGEEIEIDGRNFLVYSKKLHLMGQKILNFIVGIENGSHKKNASRRKAGIDSVSGAYNKAYAVMGLESLIFKSEIDGSNFSVCYTDVNGLNEINVKFGNNVGDKLLKKLVETIRSNTRRSDYIARMDSDEFMVILPDCSAITTERIMSNISDIMSDEMHTTYNITDNFLTYGIYEADRYSKKNAEEIIEETKQLMIKNKEK